MTSGLHGIYLAQRSLALNQAAINLINNNIANMNTEGYSKQRLEISQLTALNNGSSNYAAAQSGLGAEIDAVTRNRDAYLDAYYRKESTNLAYYQELNSNATLLEGITNELSGSGIGNALASFYNTAQQLSQNPTNSVIRADFMQKALDVTTQLNQTASQLTELRTSLVGDVDVSGSLAQSRISLTCTDLNEDLKELAELNQTINIATAQGNVPNGLLDKRDLLLDKISETIPITVTQGANNLINVSLDSTLLVQGASLKGSFNVSAGDSSNPAIVTFVPTTGSPVTPSITTGKLGALIEIGGSEEGKLTINNVLTELNKLAKEFATEINTIQAGGKYIYTDTSVSPPVNKLSADTPENIFIPESGTTITAANITVNDNILKDPLKIAAASGTAEENATGDGNNALSMAQLRDKNILLLGNTTTENYLSTVVGKTGVQIKSLETKSDSQEALVQQVLQRRESTTGVSLDEELTDLVKYQRAYEASAKIFNVVNEVLQQIMQLVR